MADLIQSVDANVKRGFENMEDGSYAEVVIATSDQLTSYTASISSGASITGDIDLGLYRLLRITMPATWDAADLTFQVSDKGDTWANLYDNFGTEYKVVAAASRSIMIPAGDFLGVRYLRIRSGTSSAAVNQTGARSLVLTLIR